MKTWRDTGDILNQVVTCEIMQVTENSNGDEAELTKHGVFTGPIGDLISEYYLDDVGITIPFSIKNDVVKVGLVAKSGKEESWLYDGGCEYFTFKFKTLGEVLTFSDLCEKIGISEAND